MDITARMTTSAGAAALGGQQSWVRELADPNSVFYQDMLAQIQKRAQEREERDREDAVIEAFGQVIDAMNRKADDPRRPEMGKSFTELAESVSRLDPDDPERIRLRGCSSGSTSWASGLSCPVWRERRTRRPRR